MQCLGNDIHSPVYFIVNPPKLAVALQLVRRHAKPDEHSHQYQAIPKLQAPFDGFEDHLFNAVTVSPAGRDEFRAKLLADIGDMNIEQIRQ